MIGVLICAHGSLASELVRTAEKIIGHQDRVSSLSTTNSQSKRQLEIDANNLISELDSGDGVLVFVDSPGGTPANICLEIARERSDVEVISGVNLPMMLVLVERDTKRHVQDLAQAAVLAGRMTIENLSKMINGRTSRTKTVGAKGPKST
ncbi:PTS sugar transporter subunit IIA [bacterium]|nr:PTS sugar transporter subunit IIA [bacterium]